MREKLKDYVNSLFYNAPDTDHMRELREEILQNTLDRYDDLVAQGCSEDSAFGQAVASIGDVRKLWEQDAAPARPVKKSRTGWIVGGCAAAAAVIALLAGLAAQMRPAKPAHYEQIKKSSLEDGVGEIVDWAVDLGENIAENVMKNTINSGTSQISYDHPEQYAAGPVELSAGGVQELKLDWLSGSVTVEAYDGDTVSITETEQSDPDLQLRWRQVGNKVYVQPFAAGKHTNLPNKDLLVRIPASLAADLKSLKIDTTSADASVSGLTVDTLEFDSVSGSLNARADCRKLKCDATSGGVIFTGTASEADVETVSGSCTLTLAATPDELSFDTTSGSITLAIPADRSFEAELDTVSGSLTCAYETQQRGKHTWVYAGTDDSRQAELEFDTVSGSVNIIKAES